MANRKITFLLSSGQPRSSVLARLLGHAAAQDGWTAQLRALLPQELASECRVGNVRDHILTVHINNAAWATRFRFLVPDLLGQLRNLADFTAVTEVRLKVVSQVSEPPEATETASSVKPPARIPLIELARCLDSAELRAAILRLAAHAETTDSTATPGGRKLAPASQPTEDPPLPD